ncbi:MAG TPA: four helix bundle protein [Balneolales bacterium]|nr:four helix bundle protein [Balneolales bacterium]
MNYKDKNILNYVSDTTEPARSFEDLIVWEKAHKLVLEVYSVTESFPKSELFGLTSQLRRAMVSVPANIAEGFKKTGKKDKIKYLNIAQGSLEEVKYYFILAQDLRYSDFHTLRDDLEEISKMLNSYKNKIKNSDY